MGLVSWCTGDEEQPDSQEALLQERLKEAEEKVAHLDNMIAGPPALEVKPAWVPTCSIQPRHSACTSRVAVLHP